jgi:hypothetical protein
MRISSRFDSITADIIYYEEKSNIVVIFDVECGGVDLFHTVSTEDQTEKSEKRLDRGLFFLRKLIKAKAEAYGLRFFL